MRRVVSSSRGVSTIRGMTPTSSTAPTNIIIAAKALASSSSPAQQPDHRRATLSQHILSTAQALTTRPCSVGVTSSSPSLPVGQLLSYAIAQREVDTVLSMRTALLHNAASEALNTYYTTISQDASTAEAAKTKLMTTLQTIWDQLFTAAALHGQIEAHSTLHYESQDADRDFLELTGGVVARSQRFPTTSDGSCLLEMVLLYRTFLASGAKAVCNNASSSSSGEYDVSAIDVSLHISPSDICEAPLDMIARVTRGVKGLRRTFNPQILRGIAEECLGSVLQDSASYLDSKPSEDDICAAVASLLDACMEVAKTHSTQGAAAMASSTSSSSEKELVAGRQLAEGALELLHYALDITINLPIMLEQSADEAKLHEVGVSELTVGRIAQLVLEQVPACYKTPADVGGLSAPRVSELGEMVIGGAEKYQLDPENTSHRQYSNVEPQALRLAVAAATMRCARLEGKAPDRIAKEILDAERWGVALEPSVVVERLLLYKELSTTPIDPTYANITPSTQAIVDDTLFLTRSVVENRPRVGPESLPADFKADYQTVHRLCMEVLVACDAINDAYLTIVTHKYHGLGVTKEVIAPLVKVLGDRGDCRVLNLVDLCTLYCGNKIDLSIVGSIFRMCEVAGDHHRAKALLSLLKEVIPGFLTKAPPQVFASLHHLKVPLFPTASSTTSSTNSTASGSGSVASSDPSKSSSSSSSSPHVQTPHMFTFVGAGSKMAMSEVPELQFASQT